ncbi:hypothetical protein K432DRAFT_415020 [Lepidopterella palustris CBS 459.81]|uniref:Alcohol dehydrogenase-like C-terminal domain-containing protein n=1 Tax=Lepidopterella palustris CBS 459.81 TaxID=1314670 RepID=A0A8E2JHX3_9PEZI|nr:hypothetical protein K432DRAFT_415020 [Lepidopterella palustris CBS 459.81]
MFTFRPQFQYSKLSNPSPYSSTSNIDGSGNIHTIGASSLWRPSNRVLLHPNTWLTGDVHNMELDKAFGGGEVHGTLQQWIVLDDERVVRAPRNLGLEEVAALTTAGATAVSESFFGAGEGKGGSLGVDAGDGGLRRGYLATAVGATVTATSSSDEKLKEWTTWLKLRPPVESSLLLGCLIMSSIARGPLAFCREIVGGLVRLAEEHDVHPVASKSFGHDHVLEAFKCLHSQSNVGKIAVRIEA